MAAQLEFTALESNSTNSRALQRNGLGGENARLTPRRSQLRTAAVSSA
jgi:hypothetical protein